MLEFIPTLDFRCQLQQHLGGREENRSLEPTDSEETKDSGPGGNVLVPKARIEALTDGVFAFAMTLLVINLVLPDDFRPQSDAELIAALRDLDGALIAYVVSFFVLGLRWMNQARDKGDPEMAGGLYLWAVLVHLFFITIMPFSTMVVGRYEGFAPAVWLYAANMILSALAAIALSVTAERATGKRPGETGRFGLLVLIATALASVLVSLFNTEFAMLPYLGNALTPFLQRWAGRLL